MVCITQPTLYSVSILAVCISFIEANKQQVRQYKFIQCIRQNHREEQRISQRFQLMVKFTIEYKGCIRRHSSNSFLLALQQTISKYSRIIFTSGKIESEQKSEQWAEKIVSFLNIFFVNISLLN